MKLDGGFFPLVAFVDINGHVDVLMGGRVHGGIFRIFETLGGIFN